MTSLFRSVSIAVAACWFLFGCAHSVPNTRKFVPNPDANSAAEFANKWRQYAVTETNAPLPTAKLPGDARSRWKLAGGFVLEHRQGRLRELKEPGSGYFICDSVFHLKGDKLFASAPSLLDGQLLKDREISFELSVFEDRANAEVVVVERRHGGPERAIWFRPEVGGKWTATVVELPDRDDFNYGEWYPIEGIRDGRLYCRVDGKLYAFPISELPKATFEFTIG
jgi:hypothetical protein